MNQEKAKKKRQNQQAGEIRDQIQHFRTPTSRRTTQ